MSFKCADHRARLAENEYLFLCRAQLEGNARARARANDAEIVRSAQSRQSQNALFSDMAEWALDPKRRDEKN